MSLTDVLYKSTMVLMDSPMANNLPHKMGPALGQKEKKSPIENRILGALRAENRESVFNSRPARISKELPIMRSERLNLVVCVRESLNQSLNIVEILLQLSHSRA